MAGLEARGPTRRPRVTVGLPVFNGERFLADAIRSILSQSFADFELLISDNGSTDMTEQISREFAAADPRVRFYRNASNIGADRNYNRCVTLAAGDYFWGIGHDDLADRTYLEKCVQALDADPGLVFCHSRVRKIDETGAVIGEYEPQAFSTSNRPHHRLFDVTCRTRWTIAGHAVLRLSALRKTGLLIPHPASDTILQSELVLLGRIYEIPEFLFFHRLAPVRRSNRDAVEWAMPGRGGSIVFPHWRRLGELVRSVHRTNLGFSEACLCYAQVVRYLLTRRMAKELPRDIWAAALNVRRRLARNRGTDREADFSGRDTR
jgi:glycosyltransferase involved in cell wall biosynthesis